MAYLREPVIGQAILFLSIWLLRDLEMRASGLTEFLEGVARRASEPGSAEV